MEQLQNQIVLILYSPDAPAPIDVANTEPLTLKLKALTVCF